MGNWATTIPAAWDIPPYDMSLLKGKTEIQKSIKLLSESLMKCHRNEENQNFWKTTAIKLNQAVQERNVCSAELNNSVMVAASMILDEEFCSDNNDLIFKSNTQPSSFLHKRQKGLQEHSASQPRPFIREGPSKTLDSKSSATIIELKAEAIHKKLLEGVDIISHERKIMMNGLSSILDLSDDSPLSQHNQHMDYRLSLNQKKHESIDSGLKYMYQVYPKHFDDKTVFTPLKALEAALQAMNDQGYVPARETNSCGCY
ncbi:hypothetical protein INT45_006863 [Circinella minor]|uniref:Uncharacterized protein n=1 Tax=Circinella minor TaxID=1195481 RepID=A0A8H7RZ60_9FUNG|nr:hypothetical protein INT45_006863 [Circinella minor]